MNVPGNFAEIVAESLRGLHVAGKCGRDLLHDVVAKSLTSAGYTADKEDTGEFLKGRMPVWRSKDTGEIEPTTARRRVDIVVYRSSSVVGLIEIESDLNDLRLAGTTRRSGHYDVWSIARAASGRYFDSYKSLERMASAAMYWNAAQRSGIYPGPAEGVALLETISSDEPSIHNPSGLQLVLVSGSCRPLDSQVLRPRLESLGARLVCVGEQAGRGSAA